MTDDNTSGDNSGVVAFLKQEWHLAPRALLAAIPIVGHSISVLIEDRVMRHQHNKLLDYAHQMARKLEDNEAALASISDQLFNFATSKVLQHPEQWKPRVIANILVMHKGDHDHILRQLLIDHASQLTDFDLATFWDVSDSNPELFPPETRYAILELQKAHPELRLLRDISERKLVQLGFLRQHIEGTAKSLVLTEIGAALIEAIE